MERRLLLRLQALPHGFLSCRLLKLLGCPLVLSPQLTSIAFEPEAPQEGLHSLSVILEYDYECNTQKNQWKVTRYISRFGWPQIMK